MKNILILLLVVGIVLYMAFRPSANESFETEQLVCPTEAMRGPDGRIHIKPGDRSFNTMSDYTGYLADLYAKGAKCLAPKVRPSREPTLGIMGGLGTNTASPTAINMESTTRSVFETSNEETTSAKTPINKLDDYEYTRVAESERASRNDLSRAVKNELMEKYKMDWANLPFNSEARAAQEDEFIAGRMDSAYRDPKTGVFFKNMEGLSLLPPDVEAQKMREAQILSSYRPTEITKHTIDSETERVAKLVNEMYAGDKDWEPVVTKTDAHKWEVTELRPKPRKETYEDAQTISLATAQEKGFTVPPPSINISDRLQDDPYFDKSGVGDRANNKFWNYKDFNKWTPGLERMFAPTATKLDWY